MRRRTMRQELRALSRFALPSKRRRKARRAAVVNELKKAWVPVSALALGILGILIWGGYRVAWTGFHPKYLWDWMDLLIIPVVLAFGAIIIRMGEAKSERENALDKQRQDALMTYFDRMEALLLQHKLRESKDGSEIRSTARARTMSILQNLDPGRKRYALQFLYESNLINVKDTVVAIIGADLQMVNLEAANLAGACLVGAILAGAEFYEANLKGANLAGAYLAEAGLVGANLEAANLERARLVWAEFYGANLKGANLKMANLVEAGLAQANLEGAILREANLVGAILREANLKGADLKWALLVEADLVGAILEEANLEGAKLYGANLKGAGLARANLEGARLEEAFIFPSQVESCSMSGAIMPDGTKYEVWLAAGKPDWNKPKQG